MTVSPVFTVDPKETTLPKRVKGGGKKGAMGSAGFWSRHADVIHILFISIHTAGKGQRHSRPDNVIEENQCGDSFQMN